MDIPVEGLLLQSCWCTWCASSRVAGTSSKTPALMQPEQIFPFCPASSVEFHSKAENKKQKFHLSNDSSLKEGKMFSETIFSGMRKNDLSV